MYDQASYKLNNPQLSTQMGKEMRNHVLDQAKEGKLLLSSHSLYFEFFRFPFSLLSEIEEGVIP